MKTTEIPITVPYNITLEEICSLLKFHEGRLDVANSIKPKISPQVFRNLIEEDAACILKLWELLKCFRMKPYHYKGFMIHHYVNPILFQACDGPLVIRAASQADIEQKVDQYKKKTRK